jgi:GNAT superfamily N-acetyltransferase
MISNEAVERAVAGWHLAIEAFCAFTPHANVQTGKGGTRIITTGTQVVALNGLICTTLEPDLDELSALASSYSSSELPWSIQIRSDRTSSAVEQIARQCGLTESYDLPFMAKCLVARDMCWADQATIKLRRIPKEDRHAFRTALAAGFEAPEEIFMPFTTPEMMGGERVISYLAEESGSPVATFRGTVAHDHVSLFSISTLPSHRRRGFARAAINAVLFDAYACGVRTALLHGSPAGKPVYESIGFKTVENWRIHVAP